MVFQFFSKVVLHNKWKSVLQQSTDFSSIEPMSITNWKEMTVSESQKVRTSNVGILVLLVRIMGLDSSLCRKRKLCNNIWNFWFSILLLVSQLLLIIRRLNLDCSFSRIRDHLSRCYEVLLVVLSFSLWLMSLSILIWVCGFERPFVEILGKFVSCRKRLILRL